MAKAADKQYAVLDSVRNWNAGDLITAKDLEEGEVERLLDLEVIEEASDDQIKAAETLKEKEQMARRAAREARLPPEQVEANVKAAGETGHPVQGAQEG